MGLPSRDVQQILDSVPALYRGPGGAVAVVQNRETIATKTWGFANLEKSIPMTPDTLMPICSISKQMTCAVMLSLEENPTDSIPAGRSSDQQMNDVLRQLLPQKDLWDDGLKAKQLCDMQSGLRDYWALAMIMGSKPDDRFTVEEDGGKMLRFMTSFHFQPGTEYSYSNINFYLLGRALEKITSTPLAQLLAERVFRPAGMTTAQLVPDSARQPGDCVGYEGDEKHGLLAAVNRIEWSGDAGVIASLNDMIAYEKYFDGRWVERGQYRKLADATNYLDGQRAPYSYGLRHDVVGEVPVVGHGGALRGWRAVRTYVEQERLSVIVMLNYENTSPTKIAHYVIRKALKLAEPPTSEVEPAQEWFGQFLDEDTQLAIRVTPKKKGVIAIRYARDPEDVRLVEPDRGEATEMAASISGDTLTISRIAENRKLVASRIKQDSQLDDSLLAGSYHCAELQSTFVCTGQDGMLYGSFNGPFGRGTVNLMTRLGSTVWVWACPRALDHTPPGDWTVVFHQSEDGKISACTIGCWLARRLEFLKV